MITVLYGDGQANDYTVPEKKTNKNSAQNQTKRRLIKIQLKIRKKEDEPKLSSKSEKKRRWTKTQLKIRKEKKMNQNLAQNQKRKEDES